MGSTTTKTVKGKEYLYYVHYENRKKKEVYCGQADTHEAKRKALELELEQLKKNKKELNLKISNLENELKISKH